MDPKKLRFRTFFRTSKSPNNCAITNSRVTILIQLIFWIYIATFNLNKCSLEKGCYFKRKHLNKVKGYKIFWEIHVITYLRDAHGSWWFSFNQEPHES